MVQELQLLWKHGIIVNGVCWRVAIVNGIWDGKGYEQVTKTMGSNSSHGCNTCDFYGVYFGKTQKYPFYYRYSNLDDSRRLKRPTGVPNSSHMYNIETLITKKPTIRSYKQYVAQGQEVQNGVITAASVGINGVWLFHALPYAHLIHPTKDAMHSANNTIKDSCCVLKPSTTSKPPFTNRTTNLNVLLSCREYKIFPFITRAENPIWPWILTNEQLETHDARMHHVLGFYNNFTSFKPCIYHTFTQLKDRFQLKFQEKL